MFRLAKWAVVGLALCVLATTRAQAGIGFQPVSQDELKMTGEPMAPGASAIILYRQVDRDDSGFTPHEDNYVRIKILTEEGRKYADVEIPFFKGNGDIVNMKGRTIKPDGSIVNFAGQAYEKELAKGRGVRYLAKTFTLPDVQVGGIVEYFYTVDLQEHYVFDSHWILSDELFTKKAQFSLRRYQNTYYPFSLRFSWQGLPAGASPPQEGRDHVVRLEVNNVPAFRQNVFQTLFIVLWLPAFQQHHRICYHCIFRPHAFWRFGFDAYTVWWNSAQLGDLLANRVRVRANFWNGQN